MPAAVMFDLDGVLVDSEQLWNEAKEAVVRAAGGQWRDEAPFAMIGMNTPEWSAYMRDELGVQLDRAQIGDDVVGRVELILRERLPLLPGAVRAVRALQARWVLGLASSANRVIIDLVLELAGIADAFTTTVSSDEVGQGKPAPDVYLEAARRAGVDPRRCVAVEDSGNGLRAAAAAGMAVIAVPNPHYPPDADALALASVRIDTLEPLTPALVERAFASSR
jgi:HAD superfamily hydrolase (TIGR01509 family)